MANSEANAQATRSSAPIYLMKTRLVLAGKSKPEIARPDAGAQPLAHPFLNDVETLASSPDNGHVAMGERSPGHFFEI
jgi:hypothetical protein